MPAHPKLRSSCDGCGTAKVKCDRMQPECGRCASHSMKCIYGVSRKMGKPPREKIRLKTSAHKPGHDALRGIPGPPPPLGPGKMLDSVYNSSIYHGHNNGHLHHPSMNSHHEFADQHYHPGHRGLVAGLGCGPESHMEDVLGIWEPLEQDPHHHNHAAGGFMVNMDALDPLYGDYVDPALALLAAQEFGGQWGMPSDPSAAATGTNCGGYPGNQPAMAVYGPLSTPESPETSSSSSTMPAAAAAARSRNNNSGSTMVPTMTSSTTRSDSVVSSSSSPSTAGGHDCAREAHDILESLSPARLSRLIDLAKDGAATAAGPELVPFDAILQLNREAGGRLGRLLACGAGCTRAPALALLYASIVARMLAWYQQAATASCAAASPSWNAGRAGGGGGGGQDPTTAAIFAGDPWDATIVVAGGAILSSVETTTSVPGGGGGGASGGSADHAMALDAFGVEDLRVQGTLKMQLLAGEMQRAARLIDKFAAFGASSAVALGVNDLSYASSSSSASTMSLCLSSSSSSSLSSSPSTPLTAFIGDGGGGGGGDGLDTLCLGLEAWLRGEYARTEGLLGAQLRELSY